MEVGKIEEVRGKKTKEFVKVEIIGVYLKLYFFGEEVDKFLIFPTDDNVI